MKWAVLGASGFVGSRFVEKVHLTGKDSVLPIVRNFSSLARLARFNLDWSVTDLTDIPAMTRALEGCDVLLHSIIGDETVILGSVSPVYEAANRAGVRRIVYLSSSAVHGQAPSPDTTEATPLRTQHDFSYNTSKVRAERMWSKVRSTGKVEVVGLRPSIVFGPRSRWCTNAVQEVLDKTAYLLDQGRGVCNTIYVDNLIHAIFLAATAPGADGEYFFVRDREEIAWKDFYAPIVDACGANLDDIHQVEAPDFRESWQSRMAGLRHSPLLQAAKPLAPRVAIRMGKAALQALPAPVQSSPWQRIGKKSPHVTAELAALQQCRWQMPCAKAEKILGYEPPVTFKEGMRRSIGWLKFAGYPITVPG